MADVLTPTVPVVIGAADGGTLLLQALADNIQDGLLKPIIFDGVADWNGTTGTDNGPAFRDTVNNALGRPIAIPPGRYWLGSDDNTFKTQSDIHIFGFGDVELLSNNSNRVMQFRGEQSDDGPRAAALLAGDIERGTTTIETKTAHGATAGEPFMIYGFEPYVTDFGYLTNHSSRVASVTSPTEFEIIHPLLFDHYEDDVTWMSRYAGKLKLDNIKFTSLHTADRVDVISIYRVDGVEIRNCEFRSTGNPEGTSDGINWSDGGNGFVYNSIFEYCRYGINLNRWRNFVARDNECNYCRHFVSPGTACVGGLVDGVVGHDNQGIIDGHISFDWNFNRIVDLAASGVNAWNCRNIGWSICNSRFKTDTVSNNIMSVVALASQYQDLYVGSVARIDNVSIDAPSGSVFALANADQAIIHGLNLNGTVQFDLGNGIYGVRDWNEPIGVVNAATERYYHAIQTKTVRPRYWQDATYNEYLGTSPGGGAANETVLESNHGLGDDVLVGYLVDITAGTGSGQSQRAIGWDSETNVLTMLGSWGVTLDVTSEYRVSRYDIDARDMRQYSEAFRRNRVHSHIFGGVSTAGDLDGRSRRVRMNMMAQQSFGDPNVGAQRYETIDMVIHIYRYNAALPVRGRHEFLISHKAVASPNMLIRPERVTDTYHATADYSLVLSDPYWSGAFDGWFEFTMDFGSNLDNHGIAVWIEATCHGVSV